MFHIRLIISILLFSALAGCGGSDFVPPVRQFGVTEAELYDPVGNPGGIVAGAGSGLVSLLLEPVTGPAAPPVGDTGGIGVDDLWFEADQPRTVSLSLSAEGLAVVSGMEVLNAAGVELLAVNAGTRQGAIKVEPGKYILRIHAAPANTEVISVLVWFGGTAHTTVNPEVLHRVLTSSPVNCAGCDLRGAILVSADLRAANLSSADLRGAILAHASDPNLFTLTENQLFKVILGGAELSGVDLSAANLSHAKLTGAVLSGAGSSPANLSAANLTNAEMRGLMLPRASMRSANLDGADLTGSYLFGADLHAATLDGANLSGVFLFSADLTSANMAQANATNANLGAANLRNANLTNLVLTGAQLGGATWSDGRVCGVGAVGACTP